MLGDTNDFVGRLKEVLPARWFGETTPVLDAVLTGLASAWSGLFGVLQTVGRQARIATANGIFLDITAADYFGAGLTRRVSEVDDAYSQRIRTNLLAPRATRLALAQALTALTGRRPAIFEPLNATDTGGYNSASLGYGVAGGYGSFNLPYQFFVTAYRPNATPISNSGGYGAGPGGYNTGPMFYGDLSAFPGTVNDADIYATIAAVAPTASVAWTNLSN